MRFTSVNRSLTPNGPMLQRTPADPTRRPPLWGSGFAPHRAVVTADSRYRGSPMASPDSAITVVIRATAEAMPGSALRVAGPPVVERALKQGARVPPARGPRVSDGARSEERRVGKEGRSR